jgi:hypothetical protein
VKLVLLNQFHGCFPGTCIEMALVFLVLMVCMMPKFYVQVVEKINKLFLDA